MYSKRIYAEYLTPSLCRLQRRVQYVNKRES